MAAGNINQVEKEWNIEVYKKAEEYLRVITPDDIDVKRYLTPIDIQERTMEDIFIQFISSAQNYQRMPKVIAFERRRDAVKGILDGFNYNKVSGWRPEDLCREFQDEFDVKADNKNIKQNSWYKWSQSIVDSAKFLTMFEDENAFISFVNDFNSNVYTRMGLPLLLSRKISGIGFALACDLIKELGFTSYAKPDVHLMDVFSKLGLSELDPIDNFVAITKMSDICSEFDSTVTPYKVDKTIWLICTGKYYYDDIKRHKPRSQKDKFIEMMLRER